MVKIITALVLIASTFLIHAQYVWGPGGPTSISSTGNTTTTPLSSAATYTGTWELNGLADVMVSCQTDNTGTLYFDFSVDMSNYSTFPTAGFKVASGIHEFHTAVKGARWFRVRLVNDTGAQSYLRLYTYYGDFRQGNLPMNQSISPDADAIVVRVPDSALSIAKGFVVNHSLEEKFGANADVDTSGVETLWDAGGRITFLTSASTLTVVSGDAGDAALGDGARTITVGGVDGDWAEQTETITLNGATNVVTASTWLGINRAVVATAGSYGTNIADITITATTGGSTQALIPDGLGITQQLVYHVPAGKNLIPFLVSLNASKITGGSLPVLTLRRWQVSSTGVRTERIRSYLDTGVQNDWTLVKEAGTAIPEKTHIEFTVESTGGSAVVAGRYHFYLIDD